MIRSQATRTLGPANQHGRRLARNSPGEAEVTLPLTHPNQPRASSRINDNYCVTQVNTQLLAGSSPPSQTLKTLYVKQPVVSHVHSAPGHSQKKELSPGPADCYQQNCSLKSVKSVSCVTQFLCVQPVKSVKNAASNLPVGARLQNYWTVWLQMGAERGLHPSLSRPAKSLKVSHSHKQLCQSSQEQLPVRIIAAAYRQKCCRTGSQPNISGVFQSTVFSPKAQQQMEIYSRPKQIKPVSQGGEIQNGDSGNHQNVPPARGVGHLNRLQGRLLPHTHTGPVQEYLRFHVQGQTYQFKALPFGLSTAPLEFTVIAKEVKLMATRKGIRIHQYLDDWLVRARSTRFVSNIHRT